MGLQRQIPNKKKTYRKWINKRRRGSEDVFRRCSWQRYVYKIPGVNKGEVLAYVYGIVDIEVPIYTDIHRYVYKIPGVNKGEVLAGRSAIEFGYLHRIGFLYTVFSIACFLYSICSQ